MFFQVFERVSHLFQPGACRLCQIFGKLKIFSFSLVYFLFKCYYFLPTLSYNLSEAFLRLIPLAFLFKLLSIGCFESLFWEILNLISFDHYLEVGLSLFTILHLFAFVFAKKIPPHSPGGAKLGMSVNRLWVFLFLIFGTLAQFSRLALDWFLDHIRIILCLRILLHRSHLHN